MKVSRRTWIAIAVLYVSIPVGMVYDRVFHKWFEESESMIEAIGIAFFLLPAISVVSFLWDVVMIVVTLVKRDDTGQRLPKKAACYSVCLALGAIVAWLPVTYVVTQLFHTHK